jgi:hypothetical protein
VSGDEGTGVGAEVVGSGEPVVELAIEELLGAGDDLLIAGATAGADTRITGERSAPGSTNFGNENCCVRERT